MQGKRPKKGTLLYSSSKTFGAAQFNSVDESLLDKKFSDLTGKQATAEKQDETQKTGADETDPDQPRLPFQTANI